MTFSKIYQKVIRFIRKNTVMMVALCAAVITCFFVPIDKDYLGYFDFKTLTCLFCVLAVVCALKNIRFFYSLAQKIVQCFKNARMSVLALVYITFIGSMLIANDMALLTFLPLGYFVLHTTGKENMSKLDKILFLADMTSAERDYPGVEELRSLEMRNLDKAMIQALKMTISFVEQKNAIADPESAKALAWLQAHSVEDDQ